MKTIFLYFYQVTDLSTWVTLWLLKTSPLPINPCAGPFQSVHWTWKKQMASGLLRQEGSPITPGKANGERLGFKCVWFSHIWKGSPLTLVKMRTVVCFSHVEINGVFSSTDKTQLEPVVPWHGASHPDWTRWYGTWHRLMNRLQMLISYLSWLLYLALH